MAKDEAVSIYKRTFEKELTSDSTSYLGENSMVSNHARIKKHAIELVNLKHS